MTILLSTGIAAIALAVLAQTPDLRRDWRSSFGLASACCCAGCVVAGFVVAFAL